MSTVASECSLFPANPEHNDLFELQPGLFYQYDAAANGWARIASNSVNLPAVTTITEGAMVAEDLKKLNRLVIPPPKSTLEGTDCVAPFRQGAIGLYSGDSYVGVTGNPELRNIDSFGDVISKEFPFQIHQHTYGFDFTLDIPRLVTELKKRGQFKAVGSTGDKGSKGDTGESGDNEILSGDAGPKGETGDAPECEMTIETETVAAEAKPGLKRALVAARIVENEDDSTKFDIEFDRQVVGQESASTSQFQVKEANSFWVLAVSDVTGTPQPVFYLDIEPIIDAVHAKYLEEVDRLKKGYEDIVQFWIQTMSDLFDEQKDALCCALEFCMSKRKSVDLRQHMESVAASAIGASGAKINLHGRNSNEAVEIGHTRLLGQRIESARDYCKTGPKFPTNPAASSSASAAAIPRAFDANDGFYAGSVSVDPSINAGSIQAAKAVELEAGQYVVTVEDLNTNINNQYGGVVKIQYAKNGVNKVARFLDKGWFDALQDAKDAYEGLTLTFEHDGGAVYIYYPMMPTAQASGILTLRIERGVIPVQKNRILEIREPESAPEPLPEPQIEKVVGPAVVCQMSLSHLSWYKKGWDTGNCCGLVINIADQDYIVFKRSVGDDMACGGGESESTPCVAEAKNQLGQHPAFAWPTLDGVTFAPLPTTEQVEFRFDEELNNTFVDKVAKSEYSNPKGNPAGYRHLTFQLSAVLFPTI